mgnify:CR=1 FL=1
MTILPNKGIKADVQWYIIGNKQFTLNVTKK